MKQVRKRGILGVLLGLLITGCSALPTTTPPTPDATPSASITALACEPIVMLYDLECTPIVSGVMLQSIDSIQHTLTLDTISITLNGTIFVTHLVNTLTVGTLEGNTAISTYNTTRVLLSGMETTIPLQETSFASSAPPEDAQPYTGQTLRSLPLFRLSRTISPQLISTPVTRDPITVQSDENCQIPEGWSGFFRIQRGDTLSAIATQFGITVEELQEGNCLTNSNSLFPDDILRVPDENEYAEANFDAETTTLQTGECTTLTWNAESASLVYFQGEAVANMETRDVCPEITTTYTLLIVFPNGEQIGLTQTLTIE